MTSGDVEISFWDHLEALRGSVWRSLIAIGLGTLLSFFFYKEALIFIRGPLQFSQGLVKKQLIIIERYTNTSAEPLPLPLGKKEFTQLRYSENKQSLAEGPYLIRPQEYIEVERKGAESLLFAFSPLEGMLCAFKISFWMGLVLTSPIWMFFFLQYFSPALKREEKSLIIPFIAISFTFMTLGGGLAYYCSIPLANSFLHAFNADIAINYWSLSSYVDYSLLLLLANALVFEFFVLLLFLVHKGILSTEFMQGQRRVVIVGAFFLGALLTPPDIFTQILMATLLIIFYELGILYSRIKNRTTLG